MANTTKKAQAISDELADRLVVRLAGSLALVKSFDSDKNPVLTIGAGVAGNKNAIIKTMPEAWPLAKDALGLDQRVYTPHKIMIATEAEKTSAGGADPIDNAFIMLALADAIMTGCAVEWYESANGVAPSLSTFSSASNLKASYGDLRRPLINQQ